MTNYATFVGAYNYGAFDNTGTITNQINNLNTLTNSGAINFVFNGVEAWVPGVGPRPSTAELTNSGTINSFHNFGKIINTAPG